MPKIDVYDINGKKVKELELNEAVFGIEPNEAVVHSVLVNFLANQRQGTQNTKTRSEVSGGGQSMPPKKNKMMTTPKYLLIREQSCFMEKSSFCRFAGEQGRRRKKAHPRTDAPVCSCLCVSSRSLQIQAMV